MQTLLVTIIGLLLITALATFVVALRWMRLVREVLAFLKEGTDLLRQANLLESRGVAAARAANRIARQSLDQQARVSTFPYLHCDVEHRDQQVLLVLSNPSTMPALDVTILVVAQYLDSDEPFSDFFEIYLRKEAASSWLQASGIDPAVGVDSAYGFVYQRSYPQFPAAKQVDYPMNLPVLPTAFFVVVQYKTILGENHLYLHCLGTLASRAERSRFPYTLLYRRPQTLSPSRAVRCFETERGYVLLPEEQYSMHAGLEHTALVRTRPNGAAEVDLGDRSGLPESLLDDAFLAALDRAMPARFLKREHAVSFDRERWSDLFGARRR